MRPKLIVALLLSLLNLPLPFSAQAAEPAAQRNTSKRPPTGSNDDLLGRTVFQTLLAEISLRRGDTGLSADVWRDLALRTRDPQALARAAEVALIARQPEHAQELVRLWLEVEPDSINARQILTGLLASTRRADELEPNLAQLLAQDKENLPSNLMHLNRMLARLSDQTLARQIINRLTAPYLDQAEAQFARSQAAATAGDAQGAEEAMEAALKLRADWESAVLIRAQLQSRQSLDKAISGLESFVEQHPSAQEARLLLARLQVGDKRYDAARKHFDRLLADNPDNLDILYPVAMLALQQGDVSNARRQMERLLDSDFADKSTVHFLLGQLDQEQQQTEAALAHYRQVTSGEQFLQARSRAAQILTQQGHIEEARRLLHETPSATPSDRVQLRLAEAQLLRETKRLNDAYIVLESALAADPDNTDLLYDAALTAERIDKPELLEAHLKRVLALQPDHAHALNALAYSYAERNLHLEEAYQLATKALEISPKDPFITDTVGWVLFRQGQPRQALNILQEAYRLRADPEIAAHIAEVLWTLERKDEARQLLTETLRTNPDHPAVNAAAKKFLP